MLDFKQNYQNRRIILRAVQEGQKSESNVVQAVGERAIHGKRELLLLLSGWLMELKPGTKISSSERNELQALTEVSFDKWIELQKDAEQIMEELNNAEKQVAQASADKKMKAPMGFLSKMAAKDIQKQEIDKLAHVVKSAQLHCDEVKQKLKKIESDRQTLAETFFRDCFSNLKLVMATQALGTEVTEITNRMTIEINNIWGQFQEQQAHNLQEVSDAIDELRRGYTNASEFLPQASDAIPLKEKSE